MDDAAKVAAGGPAGTGFTDQDEAAKRLADRYQEDGETEGVCAHLVAANSTTLYALVMQNLSAHSRMRLWRDLPPSHRYVAFQFLRPSEASMILDDAEMDVADAEGYIATVPSDLRLDFLQTLSVGAVQKIVHVLHADERAACDMVRQYGADSVGRVMHRVPPGMALVGTTTVDEAVAALSDCQDRAVDPRRSGGILLVRSHDNRLLGWTDLSTLVKLSRGGRVEDLRYAGMDEAVPSTAAGKAAAAGREAAAEKEAAVGLLHAADATSVSVDSPSPPELVAHPVKAGGQGADAVETAPGARTVQSVAFPLVHLLQVDDDTDELLRQYSVTDLSTIPVVDAGGMLLGVVRPRDAVKLLNARVAAASSADTGITSYSKSSVLLLVRKRIIWLLILAALNFGVAAVVGQFEVILAENIVLAAFIPLLAGMGGNIGAQTTGLVISAVASRDIGRMDVMYVLKKEVQVGVYISIILGLVAALMGYIRATGDSKGPVALVLGASMAVVSMLANLLGVFMPFGSLASGQDPAVSSSPLITTAIDVIGISLYLALAQSILHSGSSSGGKPASPA